MAESGEGLWMSAKERDRLKVLHEVKKRHITQKQAAAELGLSVRWVRELLLRLRAGGDAGLRHGLRGRRWNRKTSETVKQRAVELYRRKKQAKLWHDYGPTLAVEELAEQPGIAISRETLRQWLIEAKLWRARRARVEKVHAWRPRRSRFGELVQWDTSEHDWLEGRGEKLYLIAMIDDATSRLFARFVRHDSTEENMKLVRSYVEKFGRPIAFYTDKASLFQTAEKHKRDEPGVEKDAVEMPPTQIGRALRELGITWIAAHSPQAKGRVERNFKTAQDRLVKGLRVAGVKTIEQANQYLQEDYLAWWNQELTVEPANPDDAHRPLDKSHNLAASLSHVETRQVRNDYTLQWDGELYQIEPRAVVSGLRRANVRVEQRLDGALAVRYGEKYLPVTRCEAAAKKAPAPAQVEPTGKRRQPQRGSDWNRNFDLKKAPKVWQASQESGCRHGEE